MKIKIVLTVVFVFLVSTISLYFYKKKYSFQTVHPHRGPIVEAVYGIGTVLSKSEYDLKMAVPQILANVYVEEGQIVHKNNPLIVSDSGVRFLSPIEGRVTEVHFAKGEMVPLGATVIKVVNLEEIDLEVLLEQQSVINVRKGQKVFVSFENLRQLKIEAQVQSVYPRQNDFIVKINLPKNLNGIMPGMTADVVIEVGKKEQALLVPLKSLTGGKIQVLVNGKIEKRAIDIGHIDEEWAEVQSNNLSENDEIIVKDP